MPFRFNSIVTFQCFRCVSILLYFASATDPAIPAQPEGEGQTGVNSVQKGQTKVTSSKNDGGYMTRGRLKAKSPGPEDSVQSQSAKDDGKSPVDQSAAEAAREESPASDIVPVVVQESPESPPAEQEVPTGHLLLNRGKDKVQKTTPAVREESGVNEDKNEQGAEPEGKESGVELNEVEKESHAETAPPVVPQETVPNVEPQTGDVSAFLKATEEMKKWSALFKGDLKGGQQESSQGHVPGKEITPELSQESNSPPEPPELPEPDRTQEESSRMPRSPTKAPRYKGDSTGSPKKSSRSPEKPKRSPERSRRPPEKSSTSPEKSRRSSRKSSSSPEKSRRSPEKSGRSPEKSRRSPESHRKLRNTRGNREQKESVKSPSRSRDRNPSPERGRVTRSSLRALRSQAESPGTQTGSQPDGPGTRPGTQWSTAPGKPPAEEDEGDVFKVPSPVKIRKSRAKSEPKSDSKSKSSTSFKSNDHSNESKKKTISTSKHENDSNGKSAKTSSDKSKHGDSPSRSKVKQSDSPSSVRENSDVSKKCVPKKTKEVMESEDKLSANKASPDQPLAGVTKNLPNEGGLKGGQQESGQGHVPGKESSPELSQESNFPPEPQTNTDLSKELSSVSSATKKPPAETISKAPDSDESPERSNEPTPTSPTPESEITGSPDLVTSSSHKGIPQTRTISDTIDSDTMDTLPSSIEVAALETTETPGAALRIPVNSEAKQRLYNFTLTRQIELSPIAVAQGLDTGIVMTS